MAALKRLSNKYTFPQYTILFSDNIAKRYQPIVYSHECLSGPPEAVYYGILSKEETKELCIQYFFFWRYQQCHMASHRYDYEPIFVYLKDKDTKPHLIVNGGLGGASCSFHKNEVRPRTGKRDRFDIYIVHTILYAVGKNIMVRRMKAIIKQIESVVTPSGNSGHVVVPKDWIGKEVVVKIRQDRTENSS